MIVDVTKRGVSLLGLVGGAVFLATAAGASATQTGREVEGGAVEAVAENGAISPESIAASSPEGVLLWTELDPLLIDRHAMSEAGRDGLKHLLRAQVLDELARETKLTISPERLDQRVEQLDREVRDSGEARGLDDYLRQNDLTREVFREFLRLGLVQEILSRRALGIDEPRPVPAEQQEMWLDQIMQQRGIDMPAPPYPDGVAARCGAIEISVEQYVEHLRRQLPRDDVEEACFQLLLMRRVRERMPDFSAEAESRAVELELDRRRAEVAADPRYKGATFDQIMGARGVRPESLPFDPAIRIKALSMAWIQRSFGEDGLREAYGDERAHFDGRFGAAVRARMVFVRAAVMTNELSPRSFEEATALLERLKTKITDADSFQRLAASDSEDVATRQNGGDVGWVTRGDERLPETVRQALFERAEALFSGGGAGGGETSDPPDEPADRLVGPLRLASGCVLLWVDEKRPAPEWSEMSLHVEQELRRRFLRECLNREEVTTFLDAN